MYLSLCQRILCLSGVVSPAMSCVFVSIWEHVPVSAARKVFPIFSNWAPCLALLSPDCGSVLFPTGGTLSLNSYYVNDLSCLFYRSLLLCTMSFPVHCWIIQIDIKVGFWKSRYYCTNRIPCVLIYISYMKTVDDHKNETYGCLSFRAALIHF